MRKKLQVFVSSTFIDLKIERQAAVEAILHAGHIPAGMELFNAGNDSQLEVIKKWIDESDIYMLILGGRYGSIELSSGLSYTEVEYRYALEKSIPVFAIYISDSGLSKKVTESEDWKKVIEQENKAKFDAFRNLVLSKICKEFSDERDIRLEVSKTLSKFEKEYDLSGWVSGKSITSDIKQKQEFLTLKKEYDTLLNAHQKLEDKLSKSSTSLKLPNNGPQPENEFSEIVILLSLQKTSSRYSSPRDSKRRDMNNNSVIYYLFDYMDIWDLGISITKSNRNTFEDFLIDNVFPYLKMYDLAIKGSYTFALTERGKKMLKIYHREWLENGILHSI